MINIAICDDNIKELNKTGTLLSQYFNAHPQLSGKIYAFTSAYEMLDEAEQICGFDLYILDILMPKINGIDLGKALRKNKDEGEIIYLTTSSDYAIDSYDTGAFYYLMKPIDESKFFQVIDKVLHKIEGQQAQGITIHTTDGLTRINFNNLLYVEQSNRVLHYHFSNDVTINSTTIRKPFSQEVSPLLADPRFVLCGSSYVLNLHRIIKINNNEATFSSGEVLHIPTTLQKHVKKSWMDYWLERRITDEI